MKQKNLYNQKVYYVAVLKILNWTLKYKADFLQIQTMSEEWLEGYDFAIKFALALLDPREATDADFEFFRHPESYYPGLSQLQAPPDDVYRLYDATDKEVSDYLEALLDGRYDDDPWLDSDELDDDYDD